MLRIALLYVEKENGDLKLTVFGRMIDLQKQKTIEEFRVEIGFSFAAVFER